MALIELKKGREAQGYIYFFMVIIYYQIKIYWECFIGMQNNSTFLKQIIKLKCLPFADQIECHKKWNKSLLEMKGFQINQTDRRNSEKGYCSTLGKQTAYPWASSNPKRTERKQPARKETYIDLTRLCGSNPWTQNKIQVSRKLDRIVF